MSRATVTAERLRECLHYDSKTGTFTRLADGAPVGTSRTDRYVQISVDGRQYLAHRLAWLYIHGVWPSSSMDHRNLNRSDNAIANLREATQSQNSANTHLRRHSSTGIKGVVFNPPSRRPRAMIMKNRRAIHLGYFDTVEEAKAAYDKAAERLFGEFARSR